MPDNIDLINFCLDFARFNVINLLVEDHIEPDQLEYIMDPIDEKNKRNIILHFKWMES